MVDWIKIEQWCTEQESLPDSVPSSAREWHHFADQYELVLSKIEKHGETLTDSVISELVKFFQENYKKSLVECLRELSENAITVWIDFGFDKRVIDAIRYKLVFPIAQRELRLLLSRGTWYRCSRCRRREDCSI